MSNQNEIELPPESENVATGLSWSATTDIGRVRKDNQDAFLALEMDAKEVRRLGKIGKAGFDEGDMIFAVSDGMGGHNAGEFASRIAVEKITELLPTAFRLEAQGMHRGAPDLLEELCHRILDEIKRLGEAYSELEGMGATLSLCWFAPDWMHFCHVGDSRIYYLPADGKMKQVSEDHTYTAWLVRTGKLTPSQARFHPKKNILSQSLNAKCTTIEPQIGSIGFEPGDRFVICSDGLTDGLSDPNIDDIVRNRPDRYGERSAAESIVYQSVCNSGKDNTTAVVVEAV